MLDSLFLDTLSHASPVAAAAGATGFTFFMTAVGAAVVLLPGRVHNAFMQTVSLGFAAGVMVAASVWSLLIPAMDMVEARGDSPLLPAVGGFHMGVLFIFSLDRLLPHLHPGAKESEGPKTKLARSTLLFLAVTLHNIPEGMSVGLSIGMAADDPSLLAGALALALGMGIQNIPEGAAVALPLMQDGMPRWKARHDRSASAVVPCLCGGGHDLRGRRGTDSVGASHRTLRRGDALGRRGVRPHDGPRRRSRLRSLREQKFGPVRFRSYGPFFMPSDRKIWIPDRDFISAPRLRP